MTTENYKEVPKSAAEVRHAVICEEGRTKPLVFTFVPVIRMLPGPSWVKQSKAKLKVSAALVQEELSAMNVPQDGVFKAEIVYISDSDVGEWGDTSARRRPPVEETVGSQSQLLQYKITSSYKEFAAIPTNVLLQEQQMLDEKTEEAPSGQVNSEDDSQLDPHAELRSPAQLRQEAKDLYAAIDEVLEEPLPMPRSHSAPTSLQKLKDADMPKTFTILSGTAGRETKYAALNRIPVVPHEKHLTKPGVIRPVSVTPRITEEKDVVHPNPFRRYLEDTSDADLQQLVSRVRGLSTRLGMDNTRDSKLQRLHREGDGKRLHAELHITEGEEQTAKKVTSGKGAAGVKTTCSWFPEYSAVSPY
ncbi:muscular LMNA-interacting protein isoform X4 [Erpetoichthys calabaricus]|uniref:muscular LMNA-interacting protein isoform X4 n=1 Tax=Erpetoichthys calabaricus TaxID=27687 RepID=UPI0022342ACB|nr:muscular LMNA-interacting protein isoform X4 [Erpetoichthys calabaricus]